MNLMPVNFRTPTLLERAAAVPGGTVTGGAQPGQATEGDGTVEPKDEEDGKPKPKPKPKSKIPKAKTPVQEATCVF